MGCFGHIPNAGPNYHGTVIEREQRAMKRADGALFYSFEL